MLEDDSLGTLSTSGFSLGKLPECELSRHWDFEEKYMALLRSRFEWLWARSLVGWSFKGQCRSLARCSIQCYITVTKPVRIRISTRDQDDGWFRSREANIEYGLESKT